MRNVKKMTNEILAERPKYAATRMLKGELLLLKGKSDEAISLFDELTKEDVDSAQVQYFRGLAYYAKGDIRIAKASVSKAVELEPNFLKAKMLLSEIYYKERDYDLAAKECQEILQLQPDQYQVNLLLGNTYFRQKKIDETLSQYKRLLEIDPGNPTGYYRMGLYYRAEGQPEKAIENFEKALAINSKLIDAFTQLVATQMSLKKRDIALDLCKNQMMVFSDVPVAQAVVKYIEGQIYESQNLTEEAEAAFRESQKLNENYLPPYYALANIYIVTGKTDQAISEFKSVLVKNPKAAAPHMSLGVIYEMRKEMDLAETHFQKAIEINPNYTVAANNLAYILAEKGKDLNKALELAQKAKGTAPDNAGTMDTLGWVYYKKGLYDSAISEFSDALEKKPEEPMVNYHMGLARYKKGDISKAKSALEQALSLNPEFDGADDAKRILKEIEGNN